MYPRSFWTAVRVGTLFGLLLGAGSLLSGCSKPPEDPPVNAKVTDDGKPAPPESVGAPAAPGMDVEGKGGRGKRGP